LYGSRGFDRRIVWKKARVKVDGDGASGLKEKPRTGYE
jgi:hypothetical protein